MPIHNYAQNGQAHIHMADASSSMNASPFRIARLKSVFGFSTWESPPKVSHFEVGRLK
jgi:hypothetical protein